MLINLLLDYNFQSKLYESHYTIKSTFETKISLKKDIIDHHFLIKNSIDIFFEYMIVIYSAKFRPHGLIKI